MSGGGEGEARGGGGGGRGMKPGQMGINKEMAGPS